MARVRSLYYIRIVGHWCAYHEILPITIATTTTKTQQVLSSMCDQYYPFHPFCTFQPTDRLCVCGTCTHIRCPFFFKFHWMRLCAMVFVLYSFFFFCSNTCVMCVQRICNKWDVWDCRLNANTVLQSCGEGMHAVEPRTKRGIRYVYNTAAHYILHTFIFFHVGTSTFILWLLIHPWDLLHLRE